MKNKLITSKDNKHVIRIHTKHPDGDIYDGIVLRAPLSIVVFQDTSDFELEGIRILPRKWLTKIRDGKLEKCYDKILRLHEEMKNLNRKKWIKELSSIKNSLEIIRKKDIWPSIEAFNGKKKTALFIGPITKIGSKKFSIYAYDATGKWEREYEIKYSEVFSIQLFNKYTERFNAYMQSK